MADISLQYLDQPLNTVSVGYKNDDYFAEQLFPLVPVKKQSGRYWVFGRERFRQYETIRHAGAEAREIAPWSLSNNAYFCDDHSLKDKISDESVPTPMAPTLKSTPPRISRMPSCWILRFAPRTWCSGARSPARLSPGRASGRTG